MNPFDRTSRRREMFSGLVRAHGTAMAVLARRLTGTREPEDVVQAALTSAWKHFEVPETIQNPRGWLLRFVVHESGNVIGRRMRQLPTVELEEGAAQGPGEDIVTILQREIAYSSSRDPRLLLEYVDEGLSQAVQALHEDERTTLTLRAVAEFSYKEIAEVMGAPIGTVMSRLCRAREKVRVELDRRSRRAGSDNPVSNNPVSNNPVGHSEGETRAAKRSCPGSTEGKTR